MDNCCNGYCHKCKGMIWGLVGVLILINAFVWPQWSGIDGWMAFLGLVLIFGGVFKSLMPGCGCHHAEYVEGSSKMEAPAKETVVKEVKKKK